MRTRFAIGTLIPIVAGCWTGPYASYTAEGMLTETVAVPAGAERWVDVMALHDVDFQRTEEPPTYADLRDAGLATADLTAVRLDGQDPLETEAFYFRCLDAFTWGERRQAAEGILEDGDTLTFERDVDYSGGTSSGMGGGGPDTCGYQSDAGSVVLRFRLGPATSNFEADLHVELTYTREYPDKYYDVIGGGTIVLTVADTPDAEVPR